MNVTTANLRTNLFSDNGIRYLTNLNLVNAIKITVNVGIYTHLPIMSFGVEQM